jgi:hypothetical protein
LTFVHAGGHGANAPIYVFSENGSQPLTQISLPLWGIGGVVVQPAGIGSTRVR